MSIAPPAPPDQPTAATGAPTARLLNHLAAYEPHLTGQALGDILAGFGELLPHRQMELLSTLRAWFDTGGHTEAAARRLACHRSTITHRVREIAQLTGRDLRDPYGAAELLLAVFLLDIHQGAHGSASN